MGGASAADTDEQMPAVSGQEAVERNLVQLRGHVFNRQVISSLEDDGEVGACTRFVVGGW
jgi:hypothetical protein